VTEKKETSAVPAEPDDVTTENSQAAEITESGGVEDSTSTGDTDTEVVTETDSDDDAEDAEAAVKSEKKAAVRPPRRKVDTNKVLVFVVLPIIAVLLLGTAGYLKWEDSSRRAAEAARTESLQVAKDYTVKLLSYKPNTVEQDLGAAKDLLTGGFRDDYTKLIDDVVIPGAKQKQISAAANVPAVASVSANPNEAVVLVFVNQTVIVGQSAPTATASTVQLTLDRVGDRWLISKFDPV